MAILMAVARYSITDARSRLPSLVSASERGGRVTITRYGKPVAGLWSVAAGNESVSPASIAWLEQQLADLPPPQRGLGGATRRAAWRTSLRPICLDASALVSLFMPDRHTAAVRAFLRADPIIVGLGDFTSAVARRIRLGELLNVYDGWVAADAELLDVKPTDIRVASTFVRRFDLGLRAPDALHLAVCQRLGSPLFTFDERQAEAAGRLGVRRGSPAGSGAA